MLARVAVGVNQCSFPAAAFHRWLWCAGCFLFVLFFIYLFNNIFSTDKELLDYSKVTVVTLYVVKPVTGGINTEANVISNNQSLQSSAKYVAKVHKVENLRDDLPLPPLSMLKTS